MLRIANMKRFKSVQLCVFQNSVEETIENRTKGGLEDINILLEKMFPNILTHLS